jgi:phenylalanine-4-hydroxylase
VFHDLFGHVPLLFDQSYADHIQAYGKGALKAHALERSDPSCRAAVEHLSRLYWYTIEFGLLQEAGGVRAYGAGILSSPGELAHSVHSAEPERLPLCDETDLLHCMGSIYKIDTYQAQYFVIDDFEALLKLTAPDFTPYYRALTAGEAMAL